MGFSKDRVVAPGNLTGRSNISQTSTMDFREKQDRLVMNLWKMLGGEYYGHITLNNLRMFLLAVKGLHVSPDVKLDTDTS